MHWRVVQWWYRSPMIWCASTIAQHRPGLTALKPLQWLQVAMDGFRFERG
jgi:hypothetical protein